MTTFDNKDIVTWTELDSRLQQLRQFELQQGRSPTQNWIMMLNCIIHNTYGSSSSPPPMIAERDSERALRATLGWKAGETTMETATRVTKELESQREVIRRWTKDFAELHTILNAEPGEHYLDAAKRVMGKTHSDCIYKDLLDETASILVMAGNESACDAARRVVGERNWLRESMIASTHVGSRLETTCQLIKDLVGQKTEDESLVTSVERVVKQLADYRNQIANMASRLGVMQTKLKDILREDGAL